MNKKKLPSDEEVARLYLLGMSSADIAKRYGATSTTVLRKLKQLNIPRRGPDYWTGRKQSREMVERRMEKIRGDKHWAWKGGKERRPYRGLIVKERCERCGTTERLSIHHRNMDHSDNTLKNLGVLCVSCHMSEHKKAYWEAKRQGKETPKSNGPVGWDR